MKLLNGKFKQKYSARHLTPKSRFLFSISRGAILKQLIALVKTNDGIREDSELSGKVTYFRSSNPNDYLISK
jgi:hypothetical protein